MDRARVLNAAVELAGAHGGLLFEPESAGSKTARLTCSTHEKVAGDWDAGLSTETLLSRWLRVNGAVLLLPEATGLWESLPASSREWLVRRSVQACIPLVQEMKLVGWIFALGGGFSRASDPRMAAIGANMPAWAAALAASQFEEQVAARAALVSRSNRLSLAGHLAASGAHEARNSLAAVRSMVQLVLSHDAPAAEHDRLLNTALAEVDRVNAALSRTLAVGRTREIMWESIEVPSLVAEATSFCRAYAHHHTQTISIHNVTQASVHGDRNELRQVLVNVLLNACQASADGASIEVVNDTADSEAVIVVKDQGSGMAAEVMARAFEPFYGTKPDGGGLGLSISRDVVQRHGGEIVLQSVVGAGTEVTITLPLGGAHAPHSGG